MLLDLPHDGFDIERMNTTIRYIRMINLPKL